MIPTSLKRKRRIIAYDLVTRYGPWTSCQGKGLKRSSESSQLITYSGVCINFKMKIIKGIVSRSQYQGFMKIEEV